MEFGEQMGGCNDDVLGKDVGRIILELDGIHTHLY